MDYDLMCTIILEHYAKVDDFPENDQPQSMDKKGIKAWLKQSNPITDIATVMGLVLRRIDKNNPYGEDERIKRYQSYVAKLLLFLYEECGVRSGFVNGPPSEPWLNTLDHIYSWLGDASGHEVDTALGDVVGEKPKMMVDLAKDNETLMQKRVRLIQIVRDLLDDKL